MIPPTSHSQVWEFHLKPCEIRKLLKEDLTHTSRVRYNNQLKKLKDLGLGDEFEGVTHILRTGDSGAHFHNRLILHFESSIWKRYGIVWETHTLCKRHAYSLCDAHGGTVKRYIRRFAMLHWQPETAEQFAAVVNGIAREYDDPHGQSRINSRCTAYPFRNFDRSHTHTHTHTHTYTHTLTRAFILYTITTLVYTLL